MIHLFKYKDRWRKCYNSFSFAHCYIEHFCSCFTVSSVQPALTPSTFSPSAPLPVSIHPLIPLITLSSETVLCSVTCWGRPHSEWLVALTGCHTHITHTHMHSYGDAVMADSGESPYLWPATSAATNPHPFHPLTCIQTRSLAICCCLCLSSLCS